MKKIIKCFIFIIIFCLLFHCIFEIFLVKNTGLAFYFEEPKNYYDIVYIGGSNVFAHFNSVLAYDLYGYTTGLLSANSQPFSITENLIEESKKYQNPKLYVIDISRVGENLKEIELSSIRQFTDHLKFSNEKFEIINKLLDYKNIDKSRYKDFYFSFMIYHNRWKTILKNTVPNSKNIYKGFLMTSETCSTSPQETYNWSTSETELPEENKKILIDLIKYIKLNNLNIIFVIPVRIFNENDMSLLNYSTKIIEGNGYNVINFNKLDNLNIDFNTDLYNFAHMNVSGSTKFTTFFSKYLKANYDLPDHRNEKKYDSWKNEYERFKKDYNQLTGKNFNDLLN